MKKSLLLVSTLVLIFAGCNGRVVPPPPNVVTTHAYVVPTIAAQTIYQFDVDSTTGLLNPNPATAYTSTKQNFQQVAFASSNGVKYAYIADPSGAVYWCTINSDGTFTNCAATASLPPLNSWQPRAMAFATFNAQYAYVVDPGNVLVYQCAVGMTGDFSNCQQAPSPFDLPTQAPYGITFATATSGAQQSYISDAGSGVGFGDVLLCSMQNDGSFNTCAQTPSAGAPNWVPYAVTFNTVNGTRYAYVADNGTGTPGHIYQCTLNTDGSFANCTQTPANDSSLTNWYPYAISFQTVSGTQYAYVVNNSASNIGNIYTCTVNTTGALTNCALTPSTLPNPWQPAAITF
jgi:hypothetical protein